MLDDVLEDFLKISVGKTSSAALGGSRGTHDIAARTPVRS